MLVHLDHGLVGVCECERQVVIVIFTYITYIFGASVFVMVCLHFTSPSWISVWAVSFHSDAVDNDSVVTNDGAGLRDYFASDEPCYRCKDRNKSPVFLLLFSYRKVERKAKHDEIRRKYGTYMNRGLHYITTCSPFNSIWWECDRLSTCHSPWRMNQCSCSPARCWMWTSSSDACLTTFTFSRTLSLTFISILCASDALFNTQRNCTSKAMQVTCRLHQLLSVEISVSIIYYTLVPHVRLPSWLWAGLYRSLKQQDKACVWTKDIVFYLFTTGWASLPVKI